MFFPARIIDAFIFAEEIECTTRKSQVTLRFNMTSALGFYNTSWTPAHLPWIPTVSASSSESFLRVGPGLSKAFSSRPLTIPKDYCNAPHLSTRHYEQPKDSSAKLVYVTSFQRHAKRKPENLIPEIESTMRHTVKTAAIWPSGPTQVYATMQMDRLQRSYQRRPFRRGTRSALDSGMEIALGDSLPVTV